ncbi:MAG TPA: lipocalin family protein [Chitinispirillaceae bacterium]|nr:lipocalin family protein [Chitinispirillaceae bacterium]
MHLRKSTFVPLMLVSVCIFFITLAEGKGITIVRNLDLDRFCGTWYEIARLPNKQEKGMVEVTSTISKKSNGKMEIVNNGYKGSHRGKKTVIKGEMIPHPKMSSWMKVKVWLFSLDYKIIHIDRKQYQYALVTSSSDKYLWVLSRTPVMQADVYDGLVDSAKQMGFEVDRLEKVTQLYNSATVQK